MGTNDRDHAEHHERHQHGDLGNDKRRLRLGRRQHLTAQAFCHVCPSWVQDL